MTRARLGRILTGGGAIALLALVVYIAIAPTHVVDGDNAELAAAGAIGARPHPPGFPAYVMYLRLTSWIPGASPAHTAAIATAILGAAVVLVLHAACRAWGARPLAATIAVALYGASPVVLRMHTEAEVFAMNALVVATILWLAAAGGPVRGLWRVALLGLVAGIGLGNHTTCVLLAPIGLLGAVRGMRESTRPMLVAAAGVGALALGLSTYLYLFVADGPISFGRVQGFGDIVAFFTRADYGGPTAFLPGAGTVLPLDNLGALARTLGRAYLWVLPVISIVVLGLGVAKPGKGEPRWGWALLAVIWLVAGPVLAIRFNIPPTGLGLYVCQRFHLLPLLLLALPVAMAIDRIGDWVVPRISSERLRSSAFGTGLASVGFLALVATSLPWLRAMHSPAMELGIRNMLVSLPPNAVVLVNSEDLCFGADYVQYAAGVRPDVDVACWIVTSRDWYRERLARRGVPITGEFSLEISGAQTLAILATGRPLFVDRSQHGAIANLPSYPYGTLIRLLSPGEHPPALPEVVALNRRLYEAFDLAYPRPGVADDYAAVAHKRYRATWLILAGALEKSGDAAGAAEAVELAKQLEPEAE